MLLVVEVIGGFSSNSIALRADEGHMPTDGAAPGPAAARLHRPELATDPPFARLSVVRRVARVRELHRR